MYLKKTDFDHSVARIKVANSNSRKETNQEQWKLDVSMKKRKGKSFLLHHSHQKSSMFLKFRFPEYLVVPLLYAHRYRKVEEYR